MEQIEKDPGEVDLLLNELFIIFKEYIKLMMEDLIVVPASYISLREFLTP